MNLSFFIFFPSLGGKSKKKKKFPKAYPLLKIKPQLFSFVILNLELNK